MTTCHKRFTNLLTQLVSGMCFIRKFPFSIAILFIAANLTVNASTAVELQNNQSLLHSWQQKVNYDINVDVDPVKQRLLATAEIEYFNHSPESLSYLIFELPQQRFREMGIRFEGRLAGSDNVEFRFGGKKLDVDINHTYYQVYLPSPLKTGKSVTLQVQWDLQFIPRNHQVTPRAGFELFGATEHHAASSILAVTQWFPRALGYDQYYQWDKIPFAGRGEFHTEIGDYRVKVNVAPEFLVAASSKVLNPKSVYPESVLTLLAKDNDNKPSLKVDLGRRYYAAEATKKNASSTEVKNTKQWLYELNHVRDFSFVVGDNLSWWHTNLPLSKQTVSVNVYAPNNGRYLWWQHGLNAVTHTLDFLDSHLAPFELSSYSVVNITGIGMEYPGLTTVGFRGPDAKAKPNHNREPSESTTKSSSALVSKHIDIEWQKSNYSRTNLYDVIGGTIHEVAHSYFPMLVNTNERREGFLDEGLTSYFSYLIEQAWSPDFQSFYGASKDVVSVMRETYSTPVTQADALMSKLDSHYHIPATAWHVLGSQILAPGELLALMNLFVVENTGKRVYFADLIHFLNEHTQYDLTPFFDDWFFNNKPVDLSVVRVEQTSKEVNSAGGKQWQIEISRNGQIRMPVWVNVITADGRITRYFVSYNDWLTAEQIHFDSITLKVNLPFEVIKVQLDPEQISADVDLSNNQWIATQ